MGRMLRRLLFLGVIAGAVIALKKKLRGDPSDMGGDAGSDA